MMANLAATQPASSLPGRSSSMTGAARDAQHAASASRSGPDGDQRKSWNASYMRPCSTSPLTPNCRFGSCAPTTPNTSTAKSSAEAGRSHPALATAASYHGSPNYRGSAHAQEMFTAELPAVNGQPAETVVSRDLDLKAAADYVTLQAASADLWSHKIIGLTDAARALTVDSLHRGAEEVRIRLWNATRSGPLRRGRQHGDRRPPDRTTRPAAGRPKTPSGSPTSSATSYKSDPATTEPPSGCTCGNSRHLAVSKPRNRLTRRSQSCPDHEHTLGRRPTATQLKPHTTPTSTCLTPHRNDSPGLSRPGHQPVDCYVMSQAEVAATGWKSMQLSTVSRLSTGKIDYPNLQGPSRKPPADKNDLAQQRWRPPRPVPPASR